MEKKKKPAIRFKGFTDSWEQRKFSDVVEIGSGMDYKHLGEGDIPVYGTGGYMLSVDSALSEEKDAIGIGRKGTIDKPYILRAPFWTVDTLFYCIPKENHDLDFINCLFQTVDWKKKDESTGVPSLSKVIINNVEAVVPSFDEQKKIGEYFNSIDHLITLHQREFEYVYYRFIINKHKYISDNYICIYTKIYGGLKMNNKLELYHGSGQIVEFPEIRKTRYTKDFSWGFYCTKSYEQAYRWAERKHENGIVNVYSYIENSELNIKKFDGMCEEWLDFIAECRAGKTHPYDIVEGPMADDTIWNFVNDYLNKNISKEVFWEYARFKHPSHQISFHSIRALECLKYERSIAVENDTVE